MPDTTGNMRRHEEMLELAKRRHGKKVEHAMLMAILHGHHSADMSWCEFIDGESIIFILSGRNGEVIVKIWTMIV